MKKIISKAISALLAASMIIPVGTAAAFADDSASDQNYYKGVFYYRPGEGEIYDLSDSIDYYAYSDDYFKKSGKIYDDHLATLSMSLAEASVSSTREPFTAEGYKNKSRDVLAFLEDTGFSDIAINEDYKLKPTKNSIGVACAHKQITENGKAYTLLAIVPRSAGYEMEWGDNFVLGAEGDAKGFDTSSEKCLEFTRSYIAENNISGDIKVWTVGYSRGAAITNLTAKKLIDDPNAALGDSINLCSDNLYAYNFGTPMAADSSFDPRNEKYAGIFNAYENSELASDMAPPEMGFERYGTDRMIKDDSRKEQMLANLEICNPVIFEEFTTTTSSYHFSPKKIGFADGSIAMVNDDDSYIPNDAAEFLRGLGEYLTKISGGRKGYAENYEQAFSDFIGYFRSLNGDESSAFGSAFIGNEETLDMAIAMYAYFMKQKLKNEISAAKDQLLAKAKEIAAVSASAEEDEALGVDAEKIAALAAKLGAYLLMDADDIRPIAAQHLGTVLEDAMRSSGATQEQIDQLVNPEALDDLTYVLSHLFFGNIWQSRWVRPLQINNEQMKNAATLISNITCLMYDHTNEVVISWLRLDDSYFADYQPLTSAQIAGYRRVYLRTDNQSAINGAIYDDKGNTAAVIKNGVIEKNVNKWIGFTSTDDGGFFRIPLDGSYKLQLDGFNGSLNVNIGEYNCYTAKTTMVYDQTVSAEANSTVAIKLPALIRDYELPPEAEYSVMVDPAGAKYIMGDVDLDGQIDVDDVTLIQFKAAELGILSELQTILADVTGDGEVNINDATALQYYLAEFGVGTGKTGEIYYG